MTVGIVITFVIQVLLILGLVGLLWEMFFYKSFIPDDTNPYRRFCAKCGQPFNLVTTPATQQWVAVEDIRDDWCPCHR